MIESTMQDLPMCHTLEEAFKLIHDTVEHVVKLRLEHRQYIADERVWDLLVNLANYHENQKLYNGEYALMIVILSFCKLAGVRKLSSNSFGVPDARFPKPVVFSEIPGSVWGLLTYVTSKFSEDARNLVWVKTPNSTRKNVVATLEQANLPEFSEVELRRDCFCYCDGVLFFPLRFVPWDQLDEEVVVPAQRAFDVPFPGLDAPTPVWEKTLRYQFGNDQYQRNWFEGLLGRCVLPYHAFDHWKCTPFLWGKTNSGKSPVYKVISSYFPPRLVKVISAQAEKEFGLGSLPGKWLLTASELPSDPKAVCWSDENATAIKLAQRNELLSLSRKYKDPWEGVLNCPIFFTTNAYRLPWVKTTRLDSNDVSLIECMCGWSFEQLQADQIDPLYEERLLQERPVLVVKLLQSYQWCIDNFATQGWPQIAATLPATVAWKNEMLNGSVSSHLLDTFFRSVFSDTREPPLQKCDRGYAFVSRPELQKLFANWCQQNEVDCPKVLRQIPKGDDIDSLNRTLKPHGLEYKASLRFCKFCAQQGRRLALTKAQCGCIEPSWSQRQDQILYVVQRRCEGGW
jgi:hypothetical protein